MGVLDTWRSKLSQANKSLASAHKTWRDERLGQREEQASERERALADRESQVALQLAEMRAIESRRWRRKLGLGATAVGTGFIGFLIGAGTTTMPVQREVSSPARPVAVAKSGALTDVSTTPEKQLVAETDRPPATSSRPHYPNPDEALEKGLYGTGKNFNVGWYCLDKADEGGVTFEECLYAAAVALKSTGAEQ